MKRETLPVLACPGCARKVLEKFSLKNAKEVAKNCKKKTKKL